MDANFEQDHPSRYVPSHTPRAVIRRHRPASLPSCPTCRTLGRPPFQPPFASSEPRPLPDVAAPPHRAGGRRAPLPRAGPALRGTKMPCLYLPSAHQVVIRGASMPYPADYYSTRGMIDFAHCLLGTHVCVNGAHACQIPPKLGATAGIVAQNVEFRLDDFSQAIQPLGRLAVLPVTRFSHVDCVFLAFLGLHSTNRPALTSSLPSTTLAIMSSSSRMSIVSASLHVRGRTMAFFAGPEAYSLCARRDSFALSAFTNDVKQLLRLTNVSLIQCGLHGPATYLAYINTWS